MVGAVSELGYGTNRIHGTKTDMLIDTENSTNKIRLRELCKQLQHSFFLTVGPSMVQHHRPDQFRLENLVARIRGLFPKRRSKSESHFAVHFSVPASESHRPGIEFCAGWMAVKYVSNLLFANARFEIRASLEKVIELPCSAPRLGW